ncbi:tRNA (cytidine(34)-2'-O)-methyltransferase [Aurantimonas sp. MSK8Z-1]|uniref:tRNA (cytidine(34)-2'-O)-methyltransferase n=1 Tax=Mangrovibrevibacter kandeliae TaxID=2968473 RepID=UPI0021177236|nr:tRNA (cytidine(34)-2'-O)-methyltransferase [Aurantimonas sp. MSK8Z-1]MCW4113787.1 tRNA (cytidine(34)-2'-O)-methyltransferase [Aurantimonas sp. MSK8Z-1]
MSLAIALYQPDIAGNTGTILRLGACLGLDVHVIEPAGFDISDRALKRAGMDYLETARLVRHVSWTAFLAWREAETRRLVLFTTQATTGYTAFAYRDDDVLLFGRESAGVPEHVHATADARVRIGMIEGARSLNLAVSAGMAAGEANRQVNGHSATSR